MVIQEKANQGYEKEEQSWSVKVMEGTIASPAMEKFQREGGRKRREWSLQPDKENSLPD